MQRYFLQLAYRGANFHGWQTQPNNPSVQATIELALAKLCQHQVPITGAGRTDAGVNAAMMIAHLDLPQPLNNPQTFLRSLNAMVGHDIAILDISPVHPTAHARFDATARTYHYYLHTNKSPFFYPLSWKAPNNLDFQLMNQAAQTLIHTSDFTSFAKLHSDTRTNICKVTHAQWQQINPYRWVFVITADRFLRNMVRAITGTLIDVGRHKLSINDFQQIIDQRDRCAAGTSMPPHPLFLHQITYPYYTPPFKPETI